MLNEPLVSVILPAYNAEKTIQGAINSLLEQTVSELEVMVVDDGSTDGTVRQVEAIPDPRIKLLKLELNCGPAKARNVGMKNARGRWIAFVDADDEWVVDRLEHLLEVAGDSECFVTDWLVVCRAGRDGRLTPCEFPPPLPQPSVEDFDFGKFVRWRRFVFGMVPRDVLTRCDIKFPEWTGGAEWALLIPRLTAQRIPGRLLHRVGYLCRVTGAHRSSTLRSTQEQLRMAEFLAADPDTPETARELFVREAVEKRKRLLVAALREHQWRPLAGYVGQHPVDLVSLLTTLIRFLGRRFHYLYASVLLAGSGRRPLQVVAKDQSSHGRPA